MQGRKASGRRWASERGAGEDMGCRGVIEERAGGGGGDGLSDAHAFKLAKAGPAGVTVGVTVESQGRMSSSSPVAPMPDFLGGAVREWW